MEEGGWQRREVLIAPNDVLFLYTDGVIEAECDPDTPFGMERLLNSAKPKLGQTAEAIKQGILNDVTQFIGDRPLLDDMILLVIKRD
jgi:sigma-B regulation protein RsbU (phosphoserine phosphatase)